MATPVGDSYNCAPGGVIAAGRFRFPQNARIAIWGQSNALGRAQQSDISASPLSADTGLADFLANGFDRVFFYNGSAFARLTATNNGCDAGQFGAEFGLAVRWMRETTTGNLYIEKAAGSGVSITLFDPIDNWYYNSYKNTHNAATAWLSANGVTGAINHWIWNQGEADAAQTQAWYQEALQQIIDVRAADGLTTGKSILFQLQPSTFSYGAGVAAAKAAIAAANPSAIFAIPAAAYMKADNVHQNGRGQLQIGYDAFEKIFNAPHIAT